MVPKVNVNYVGGGGGGSSGGTLHTDDGGTLNTDDDGRSYAPPLGFFS